MENKMKKSSQRSESSLLLKPSTLVTWNNMPGNSLFMPIAVESPDVNTMNREPEDQGANDVPVTRCNEPIFAPVISNEQYVADPRSISQLEQPLMVCKSPSPIPQVPPVMPFDSSNTAQPNDESLKESFLPPTQSTPVSQFIPSTCVPSTYETANLEVTQQYQYCAPIQFNANSAISPLAPPLYNQTEIPLYNHPRSPASFQSSPMETNEVFRTDTFVLQPVQPHWFYKEIIEHKELWYGFSPGDSQMIEEAYQNASKQDIDEEIVIPVVGGRYDVYVLKREKKAVYWEEKTHHVRRCTWFYKTDGVQRYVPYDEASAIAIDELYQKCALTGKWQQKVILEGGEVVMIDGPHTVLHYTHGLEVWPTVVDTKTNPKIACRGVPDGVVILTDESKQIDHLVFIVQGIGSFCDLSFRTVYQCVDGFREIGNNLIPIHFKSEYDNNMIGRIEFLPLAWHASLHTDGVGFDRQMKSITLPSIPKLRYFTNDTLLDILLYSSPMYCQAIIDTVTGGLNRLFNLFLSRNPDFKGHVSVAGHSLGSLILFDILANQSLTQSNTENVVGSDDLHDINLSNCASNVDSRRSSSSSAVNCDVEKTQAVSIESVFEDLGLQDYLEAFLNEKMDLESLMFCDESELKDLGLPMGPRKKLLAYIKNSDTKMFCYESELKDLGLPMDPRKKLLAYIKNSDTKAHLVNTVQLVDVSTDPRTPEAYPSNSVPYSSPSVYPLNSPYTTLSSVTFQGLEFHPACFFALGSPISMFLAVRGFSTISEDFSFPTCPAFFHIFHPYDPVAFRVEPLIDPNFGFKPVLIPHHKGRKRMHLEIRESISKMGSELKQKVLETLKFTWNHINLLTKGGDISTAAVEAEVDKLVQEQISNEIENDSQAFTSEAPAENICIGRLNKGRRIDYVLQEKPIEALNEYIFALTSHATYWNSEDTVLMILKEVYGVEGVVSTPTENKEIMNSDFQVPQQRYSMSFFPTLHSAVDHNYKLNSDVTSQEQYFTNNLAPMGSMHSPLQAETANLLEASRVSPVINADSSNASQSSIPPSKRLGPPPLSGFVRKSPFTKP